MFLQSIYRQLRPLRWHMHTVELCDWTRHGSIMYMGRTVFKEVSFRPGLLLLHTQVNIDQLRSVKISQDKILFCLTQASKLRLGELVIR